MSGFTPIGLTRFRQALKARGCSLEQLAEQVGTTRSYLSRVLWGHLESADTRKRIHAVTTADEWAILCTVENWATWNKGQSAADAAANTGEYHWVMRSECMHCHGDRRFVPSCRSQARIVTHGLCSPCLRIHFPDFTEEIIAKLALETPSAAAA